MVCAPDSEKRDEALQIRKKTLRGAIAGRKQSQLSHHHDEAVQRLSSSILEDGRPPLNHFYQLLPSGQRYKVPRAKKNAESKSLVPVAIKFLNQ